MVCSLWLGASVSRRESAAWDSAREFCAVHTRSVMGEPDVGGKQDLACGRYDCVGTQPLSVASAGSTAASTLLRASDACKEKFCGLKTEVGPTLELVETLCESRLVRSHKL
eukprot:m.486653 g.486653  ORF g.486653 m.486653 type:complete len:111 (-) comp78930_c0_seq1:337-669(-)